MKKILYLCLLVSGSLEAQPYLDLGQLMYHNSPGKDPAHFEHIRAQINLPVIFKDSSIFLVNPIWEERWVQAQEQSQRYHLRGLITWMTYTRRLGEKWEGMVAFIPRWNGQPEIQFKDGFQPGGAVLVTYKKRPGLTVKLGLYYNKEFFGNFFMPLAGIDWKINSRQRLFGILPGYMTYEYLINSKIAWGGNFRTFTNSYKLIDKTPVDDPTSFIRIDDNQLGAYLDFYATKKIVINLEGGYSIMRKVRAGVNRKDNMYDLSTHDGLYVKACLQYRLRFDGK